MNKRFSPLKLKGVITSNLTFSGRPDAWRDWQLVIAAHAPWISLAGVKLEEVDLKFHEHDHYIGQCNLTASVYGGQLLANSSADLTMNQDSFLLNFNLQKVDLSKAKNDLNLKGQNLQGMLDSSFNIHGLLTDANTVEGAGFVSIKDGLLWQSKLLKGLWDALAIKEFKEVIFTEAYGDFDIQKSAWKPTI